MNAMNQIIIEGNVVRDSVVKETPRGMRVATIPIASNRFYKDANGNFQSDVSFFDVQAWGENFCKRVAQNAVKGRAVRIVGRLKQDRWKGENGKMASRIYIVADHIDFKPVSKENSSLNEDSKTELEDSSEAKATPKAEEEYEKESLAETVF